MEKKFQNNAQHTAVENKLQNTAAENKLQNTAAENKLRNKVQNAAAENKFQNKCTAENKAQHAAEKTSKNSALQTAVEKDFEKYEYLPAKLAEFGFSCIADATKFCQENGIDVEKTVREVQPICFDNAVAAYTLGTAIALKSNCQSASEYAEKIGEGLQAFCVKGSVADERQIGLGHGRLAARLLDEKAKCFCFLAGHESFAAAEGAMGIARTANKIRKTPLKIVLNGLGKDAAYIIARVNGFTFVSTNFDHKNQKLQILQEIPFSKGEKAKVKIYGAFDVSEGVAIMQHEGVDVSITGNSTNPTRFQHPVAGTYKKWCIENGKPYFSVASGGGTGRTLHPDNMRCGPASYGMTDTMGRMHCDAQFAGSSSVPAHVAMMGFIGMGNNPMVGATVSLAVAVSLAKK